MATTNVSTDSKVSKENSFNDKEFLVIVNETEKEVEDESHNDFQAKVSVMNIL